jgi:transcriptional regulator with XRE-family HTH domain
MRHAARVCPTGAAPANGERASDGPARTFGTKDVPRGCELAAKPLVSAQIHHHHVPTRETKLQRGKRRAETVSTRLLTELRAARVGSNLSQRTVAKSLGWSHTKYSRLEASTSAQLSLHDVGVAAAALGLELSAQLHPAGEAQLDKGHQALIRRFRAQVSELFSITAEAPFPNPGDARSWDLFLRIADQRIGVEAETRIRDAQQFVRKIRAKEESGGADLVLVLLSDSAANRRFADELRLMLGPDFATKPSEILSALRRGERLPGSGVVLL